MLHVKQLLEVNARVNRPNAWALSGWRKDIKGMESWTILDKNIRHPRKAEILKNLLVLLPLFGRMEKAERCTRVR
jgi:hypothetical protein